MTSATHPARKPHTVYYVKYRPLLLLLTVLMLAIGIRSLFRGASFFFTLSFFFNALWMFVYAQTLRIVISPSGVAYHNFGLYTIEASWTNVVGIKTLEVPLLGSIQYLILNQPTVIGWTGLAWMVPSSERGRVIPLSNGWASLPELERNIRYYIAKKQPAKSD